ncbi:hypothetical protein BEP19_13540 [Ammoniphilus oxalaticus]|uniref:Uncharacterized protein n=1 Tax=Ammoniphilus oxalaticus TaxID=66863 RepID=A0A419SF42_9BACL|nr:hypothetical protein [Ammoniphilus oxalaticus]RKD22087.1 hypothetical protein BEP19_13540 [Ammoniphilus oxalaticus]
MSFLKSLFGPDKEEQLENKKEVYRKFLSNYGRMPEHEYLKELTLEAGQTYYAALRKNGKLTAADEEAIQQDLEKAVKENEKEKLAPAEEEEMRKIYEQFMKEEGSEFKH